MEVEIIYSGLCSFLNLTGKNETMPEPSVILVRAEKHPNGNGNGNGNGHGNGHGDGNGHGKRNGGETVGPDPHAAAAHAGGRGNLKDVIPITPEQEEGEGPPDSNGTEDDDHRHIPFIAFDTRTVKLENATGFQPVPNASSFKYLQLDGVRVSIDGDAAGLPKIHPTYRFVVSKDDYWPEAKNKWNRDYVPARGGRPKKSAVAAFMRLGGGRVSADRISDFEYKFTNGNGTIHSDYFAEEVLYQFEQEDSVVEMELRDLETNRVVQVLRFSPADKGAQKVSLFMGNNMPDGMDDAVHRTPRRVPTGGDHFSFLNQVAAAELAPHGPTAIAVDPPPPGEMNVKGVVEKPGGGGSAGFCGPGNANGG